MTRIVVLLFALLVTGCAMNPKGPELTVVPQVDIPRYMGVWHEIARYPNSFQEGCVDSQATYSLNEDGTVKVVNECTLPAKGGKKEVATGKAKVVDPATNAKLKVSFFWPFYGNYWIVELGKDYEYVVVSEPSRKYLWILAREKALPKEKLDGILERLAGNGFEVGRLIFNKPG